MSKKREARAKRRDAMAAQVRTDNLDVLDEMDAAVKEFLERAEEIQVVTPEDRALDDAVRSASVNVKHHWENVVGPLRKAMAVEDEEDNMPDSEAE